MTSYLESPPTTTGPGQTLNARFKTHNDFVTTSFDIENIYGSIRFVKIFLALIPALVSERPI